MWEELKGQAVSILWKGAEGSPRYTVLDYDPVMRSLKLQRINDGTVLISPFQDVDAIVVDSGDSIMSRGFRGLMELGVYNILTKRGVRTIGELANMTEKQLRGWTGIGNWAISQIKQVLKDHGLELKA